MAEVEMASPLFSDGVHHAEVSSPMWGNDVPDPLGYLAASPPEVGMINLGSGDAVNDWKPMFPDDSGESGRSTR